MLKLYLCRFAGIEPAAPEEMLSAYRRERLSVQKNEKARRESVFPELLLCYALRDNGFPVATPLRILTGEFGKPYLANGECFFSLSHSAEAALCALCDREIGADLQINSTCKPALVKRFFSPDEQNYIFHSSDPDAAFTEVWTKKESWCKRSGLGLSLPLPSFSVFDESISSRLFHTTAGEYHVAAAADELTEPVSLVSIDANALLP